VTEQSNAETRQAGAGPPPSPPPPPDTDGETNSQDEEKSPAYGFRFATIALVVGFLAFALTIWAFGDKFDAATVTGALGSLFTLIGTVAGAYFGAKSSDTANRAERDTKAAHDRLERANRSAKAAWGGLDPNTAKELRDTGLL
jgi:hypothetical protein